jgi:hypothetical protein
MRVIWTKVHLHCLEINIPNDVEGNLGDKRFATLILTVFAEDNTRVGPVLIFKGKGHVSSYEKSQYAQGVTVFFTPIGVINGLLRNQYIKLWWSKVKMISKLEKLEYLLFSLL